MNVVLDEMSSKIKKEGLERYIIILGDSVTWGTPESSDNSLVKYMNESSIKYTDKRLPIFNLSAPSMQAGDFYTLLLELDKRNISTENVIINMRYASFIDRNPGPRVVFWLYDNLKELDPITFNKVSKHLQQNGIENNTDWLEQFMTNKVLYKLPLYKYRDFIPSIINKKLGTPQDDAIGDTRPWYEKQDILAEYTKSYEYLSSFNDSAFDMSENNWNIYFLNKIIQHQQESKTLIFLSGANPELSKDLIEKEGYQQNLKRIDNYFADKPVNYANLQGIIGADYYTDHTHFTKEGNEQLAQLLWELWYR